MPEEHIFRVISEINPAGRMNAHIFHIFKLLKERLINNFLKRYLEYKFRLKFMVMGPY